MANSFLAAIRAATGSGAVEHTPDSGNEDVPTGGRPDTQEEEISMSVNNGTSAAAILAGITDQAIAEAAKDAVSAAFTEGEESGAKVERERLTGILSAEGIKGDGKRMSAALDLAAKSPDMSAEDVTGFITGNVSDAKADSDPAASYEAGRVASVAGLASPASAPQAKGRSLNSTAIYESRRKQANKE